MLAYALPIALADDAFTPWEGSRWFLEVEETTPVPIELDADLNRSFQTRALQIRMVLSCPSAHRYGAKKADLDCIIEDLSLQATPRFAEPTTAVIATSNAVLADLDATLTGARLTVTLTRDGRVVGVDLPDAKGGNRRQNQVRENLRLMATDLVAGWHLKRPEIWREGWTEKNTALVHPPTTGVAASVNRIEHEVSEVDGRIIVQSKGEGTFTTPFNPLEFSYQGKGGSAKTGDTSLAGASSTALSGPGTRSVGSTTISGGRRIDAAGSPDASTPTEYLFEAQLTGVAVLDEHGRPVERVWAMLGAPAASSVGAMMGTSLWYAGHQRLLAADEAVDVGPTQVVAAPGASVAGLPVWTPLQSM